MNRIDLSLAFTIISQNIISKYDLVVFQCLGAMRLYKRKSKRNNIKKAQWMKQKILNERIERKLRNIVFGCLQRHCLLEALTYN